MKNAWMEVYCGGNGWSQVTVYVNPMNQTAKVCTCECTYWGYHDESEWENREIIVPIEAALSYVRQDRKAIALIEQITGKTYEKKHTKRNKK